jgi:SP family myo-inositol transporter-like MFS transporter 13
VISATLVSIGSSLGQPLTVLDKSLITSSTALFALLISPASGLLADQFGRKRVVLVADLAFILGALLQAVSSTVWLMIIGRSIVGVAVGAGSFVAPLYIAELAPAPFRGRLMTLNVLFITVGQVVAYVVGWGFIRWGEVETAWRWIVQCVVMLFMPETPRWLVMIGDVESAKKALVKVFGKGIGVGAMVDQVLKAIEKEVHEEEEAKSGRSRRARGDAGSWFSDTKELWNELFRVAGNRRALTIACLLQGLQQLCGFVSLTSKIYYSDMLILSRTP